ncbi:hypothetical protein FZEAL_3239 [Fusarium zealandicum]|uniref:NmrA-like domain-containing protein n=1 Tax=Fusarium zealandicum TaxID=1053134 RepID=A0A8H4UPS9_9HYPO|nr:hypothetical protein FZEAL_3239 [Fusarium zealandicum]
MAKLLTVFGTTGQQGGSLIRYIIDTPTLRHAFMLRGITRDASKPAAISLKNHGIEIVEADMNIRSSLDKAVAGSHVVFSMTNYWETGLAEIEVAQGKAIADAAVAAGVGQIIWSSLPDVSQLSKDNSPAVEHFETKAQVEEYMRMLDIKTVFLVPGWFMQNQLAILKPEKTEERTYVFSMPWSADSELPLIDIRDTGKFIAPALLGPDSYHGKTLTCTTAFYTLAEIVDTWTRVTGTIVKLKVPETREDYVVVPAEMKHEDVDATSHINKFGYFGLNAKDHLACNIGT